MKSSKCIWALISVQQASMWDGHAAHLFEVGRSHNPDITDQSRIVIEACLFLTLLCGRRHLAGAVNSRAKI